MKTTIRLHPEIAKLVGNVVQTMNKRQATVRERCLKISPRVTKDAFVNEILWCALRSGDITKHYMQLGKP